jgi:hypothetical protein
MRTAIMLILTSWLLASCQGKSDTGNTPFFPTPKKEEPVERVESLTRSEIEAFMERWLRVYNSHTFDTYVRLYDSELFVGVKRPHTGKKNTYNYEGWVENKRNEFRKFKPEVMMNNLRITNLNENGKSKVSFEQIWVSYLGNYADKGEKVMTLRKVDGEIKITYEELLYSEQAYEYLDGYGY